MQLGARPWTRIVFLATLLVFVGVAVYVYGFRFYAWVESDAAVPALLADRALAAGSPVVADWYYANGEVWVLAPHLLAMIPVAVMGLGPTSLFASVVAGFVIELVVLVLVYKRLGEDWWIAIVAAMATLMAWSAAHVGYVYIQLAYGFGTCAYILVFFWLAVLAEATERGRSWRLQLAGAGVLVAVVAVAQPARALVYELGPFVFACVLWPWRIQVRRRLLLAAVATLGWLVAWLVYTYVFSDAVAFSSPRGHAFALGGVPRIARNLGFLARGFTMFFGGELWRVIPSVLLFVGALSIVVREVFASRDLTARRLLCVISIAQFFGVLVLLTFGNLLTDPESVRYLLPGMLSITGLAVVVAARTIVDELPGRFHSFVTGWLVAVPLVAAIASTDVEPPAPSDYEWPDPAELADVADALVRRGLTHGFAINNNANLLTLDSGGAAHTCRIKFGDIMMPQRWLDTTSCYTASALPDRFYVVAYKNEQDRFAMRATLPPPLEQFSVGPRYEVFVYRTSPESTAWLELPVPDGELATFPLRLPATHLQLRRNKKAVIESGDVVATGQFEEVVWGPYMDLPRGEYELRWIGNAFASSGNVAFRVTARKERDVVAQIVRDVAELPTTRADLMRLSFTLEKQQNVEFPVELQGGARIALHELVIEKKRKP